VNLGVGATTIRKMDQRVRYYFSRIKPGQVIIQADPHLFADYRLQAPGTYVPEIYSNYRLRALDPQHRGFMLNYWTAIFLKGRIKETAPVPDYDELWRNAYRAEETKSKEPVPPVTPAAAPPTASAKPATDEAPPVAEAPKPALAPSVASPPKAPEAAKIAPAADETPAKFKAFMEIEVTAHTPVLNFREREEAGIYRDMIAFLIRRGASVCLVNYPVDKFYRQGADAIPAFAAVHQFYREVGQENHIPYASFWARFDDPSMYQNTDHVNAKGSAILAREAREACFGKPAP
jgi:hypothetical protein